MRKKQQTYYFLSLLLLFSNRHLPSKHSSGCCMASSSSVHSPEIKKAFTSFLTSAAPLGMDMNKSEDVSSKAGWTVQEYDEFFEDYVHHFLVQRLYIWCSAGT